MIKCLSFIFFLFNIASGQYLVHTTNLDSSYYIDSVYINEIHSTILIGLLDKFDNEYFTKLPSACTGFFIYDDLFGTNSYYLVTNLHCLKLIDSNFSLNQFVLFHKSLLFNRKRRIYDMFSFSLIPFPLILINNSLDLYKNTFFQKIDSNNYDSSNVKPIWRTFDSLFVDIALLKINPRRSLSSVDTVEVSEHKPYLLSQSISYDSLTIGDSIFSFGYPLDYLSNKSDTINLFEYNIEFSFPIQYLPKYNSGIILKKALKYSTLLNEFKVILNKIYLTSIISHIGQSGSPVFINRNNMFYLIGIISASDTKGKFSVVWPVDWIKTILHENFDYFNGIKPKY